MDQNINFNEEQLNDYIMALSDILCWIKGFTAKEENDFLNDVSKDLRDLKIKLEKEK
jgi:hypothetical protein